VETTSLNGDLEVNVFMSKLETFVVNGKEQKEWKLIKSLYGPKQAPHVWY
jgi:hypothetical protein